jgi:hypothetical protein
VIAGLLHQIVQSGALSPQHEDAICPEVELRVIGRSTFIEAKHPDILLLHLLERANKVRNTGDPHMLGGPGRGFGYRRGHGRRSPFRQNDAIDAGAVGGPEQRSEIVRVFDAVESKEEFVLSWLAWRQQVLYPEEFALSNDGQHTLMRIRPGKSGELVPGFERYTDTVCSAELDQPFEAIVSTLSGEADMVKLPGT